MEEMRNEFGESLPRRERGRVLGGGLGGGSGSSVLQPTREEEIVKTPRPRGV